MAKTIVRFSQLLACLHGTVRHTFISMYATYLLSLSLYITYLIWQATKPKFGWNLGPWGPVFFSKKRVGLFHSPPRSHWSWLNHEKPLTVLQRTNKIEKTRMLKDNKMQTKKCRTRCYKTGFRETCFASSWWMLALRYDKARCLFSPFTALRPEPFAIEHWCTGCIFETSVPPCSFDGILSLFSLNILKRIHRLHMTSASLGSVLFCEHHLQGGPCNGVWAEVCKEDAPLRHTQPQGVATPPSVLPNCWPLPQLGCGNKVGVSYKKSF